MWMTPLIFFPRDTFDFDVNTREEQKSGTKPVCVLETTADMTR